MTPIHLARRTRGPGRGSPAEGSGSKGTSAAKGALDTEQSTTKGHFGATKHLLCKARLERVGEPSRIEEEKGGIEHRGEGGESDPMSDRTRSQT